MSTPIWNPSQVPVGSQPVQIIQGGQEAALPVLLENNDPLNTVYVGSSPAITIAGSNTVPIGPLATMSIPGNSPAWAVALDGTLPLILNPGGANPSASPVAVASALVASGFAGALAAAIAQEGIALTGSPVLLYNGQITTTVAGTGGWGSTIPSGAPEQYGLPSGDYQDARTQFDGLIGTKSQAAKIFNTAGNFMLTPTGQMQAAINAGCRIWMCYDPGFAPTSSADRTSIINSLNAMKAACTAAGTGASIVGVILHSEPNSNNTGKPTAAQFIASYNFYGPNIISAGFVLGFCILTGGPDWTPYIQHSNGFTPAISFVLVDMYASAYNNNIRIDKNDATNINTIAGAYTPKLSVGFGEMGRSASPTATPSDSVVGNYLTYIAGFQANRTVAGLVNVDCMWFDGPGTKNCITSTQNTGLIPLIQKFITAINNVPVSGIAAGASAVLAPLAATPVAGFAFASTISYDIVVNLIAAASSTNPFATVQLDWLNFDTPTATPVKSVAWTLPAGTTGTVGTFTMGIGPMHGRFLRITITNQDTVQMSVSLQLNGTGRIVNRHNWNWDVASSVAVPTFILPTAASSQFGNVVGSVSAISVNAGTTSKRLMGMFSGECFLRMSPGGAAAGKIVMVVAPACSSVYGSSALVSQTLNGEFSEIIILPRTPMVVSITNNDTVTRALDLDIISYD